MLVGVNEELAKANDYFKALKPECIEVKVSYEDMLNFMKDAEADKEYKHKTEVKTKLEKDQAEFEVGRSEKMLVGVNRELAK